MALLGLSRGRLAALAGGTLLLAGAAYVGWHGGTRPPAATTAGTRVLLDPQLAGVYALLPPAGPTTIEYQNGHTAAAGGLGVLPLTLADHQKDPGPLAGIKVDAKDFPVLVFFNRSGFDGTGRPVLVRRARDGGVVYSDDELLVPAAPLRLLVSLRGGGYRGHFWDTADPVVITEDDWFKHWMGLGTAKQQEAAAAQAASGLRGKVYGVGGTRDALAPIQAPVQAYAGTVGPQTVARAKLLAGTVSAADGSYSLPLPPGTYTLVIEVGGRLYGNSARQDAWPSVEVKDGAWTDYDFRKGP